ncbi:hypothetical protein V2J09_014307 [Rumex salicifolius]
MEITSKDLPTKRFHGNVDVEEDDSDLELGLGLSLGGGGRVKFLTAQDLPTSLGCHGGITGAKRPAHATHQASSPPALSSQVVGWPPVGSYRMNNLANQTRASSPEDGTPNGDCGNKKMNNGGESKPKAHDNGFVKVNMDGVQIGRKLDLNAHSSYDSLTRTIEDMFFKPSSSCINHISREKDLQGKSYKILDGSSSEFVLTYEDKEGDWMLVGDVPFRMFLGTVKRLRIMRTSEANGLAPRSQERNDRLRSKPI